MSARSEGSSGAGLAGDEGTAGAKILFLEHMVDDLYFSARVLEKHFPTVLAKSARRRFLQS